ncbi:MAG: ATP-binding protein [Trebonia sp.]
MRGDQPFAIMRYLHGPEPERRARRLATEVLADLGIAEEITDDVQLAVCELVTNARRHAPPPYELRIFICANVVKVAVADGGADLEALAGRLAQTAAGVPSLEESGRGLQMITALFPARCGVEPAPAWPGRRAVKQVWISVPHPAMPVLGPSTAPAAQTADDDPATATGQDGRWGLTGGLALRSRTKPC